MTVLRLIGFSGETPRAQPRLLPAMGAQRAENVRFTSGAVRPLRRSRLVRRFTEPLSGPIRSLHRHQGEWLAWSSLVQAVPGPVAQDRLYYTGDGVPQMRVNGQIYPLAVPRPMIGLTATLSGTASASTDAVTTRIYSFTWVTGFGEESAPAKASNEVAWKPGQSVTLSGFPAPPSGRAITRQRLYRSQTSSSGVTSFNFIAEREASDASFIDQVAVDAFGEVLPSTDWTAPPPDLAGLISLPNGMMAGFVDRDLYFCEPWRPHAWPEKYVLTTDYPIVALGAFGSTLVVLTQGHPYLVTGTAPDSMAMERLDVNLPCINARGVVDLGYGLAYPSHDGLVTVSASGPVLASASVLSAEQWRALNPATLVAGRHEGLYVAAYEALDGQGVPERGLILIDASAQGGFLSRASAQADAIFNDMASSRLFLLDGLSVREFDAPGAPFETLRWRSRHFVLPLLEPAPAALLLQTVELKSPAQMRQDEQARQAVIARNRLALGSPLEGALDAQAFNVLPLQGDVLEQTTQPIQAEARLYADGRLIASVRELNVIKRLPAGYRAQILELEITGTATLAEVRLGSPDEIAQVS